jgi:hypothetical protein
MLDIWGFLINIKSSLMGENGETQEYSICGRTAMQLKAEVDSQYSLSFFIKNDYTLP